MSNSEQPAVKEEESKEARKDGRKGFKNASKKKGRRDGWNVPGEALDAPCPKGLELAGNLFHYLSVLPAAHDHNVLPVDDIRPRTGRQKHGPTFYMCLQTPQTQHCERKPVPRF